MADDPTNQQSPASEREGQVLDFTQKPSATVSPSMLAEAIRRGWQVTPERKQKYFAALDDAIENIQKLGDYEQRARVATACTKVLVQEQDAALKDLHEIEKRERLDKGLATERFAGVDVNVPGLPNGDQHGIKTPTATQGVSGEATIPDP